VLTNEELKGLKADDLVAMLHDLPRMSHRILYYGPSSLTNLQNTLKDAHHMPDMFIAAPEPKVFSFASQSANQVLFADFDMVQSEIRWIRNLGGSYDPNKQPVVDLFNNYFGGNMGALVFQTIRESKALAYSTSALVVTPDRKDDPFYVTAYVGCQADKFNESIKAMNELLNELPKVEDNLNAGRSSMKKDIESERITHEAIMNNFVSAERKGLNYDIRKNIYQQADKLTYADLKKFHTDNLANKNYTYCIVASEKKLNPEDVQKLGEVKKLSLEEIFGY
jgi:predicted Zn-dependent peptidase